MPRYLFTLLLVLLVAADAFAATYYVQPAPTGDDTRSCATAQTIGTPKATLNSAVACLSAGDALLVRAGTYAESLLNNVPSGTSWAATVRIANYASETVWMQPPAGSSRVLYFGGSQRYIEFDGINLGGQNIDYDIVRIDWCDTHFAHHIRIKNAELIGNHTSSFTRQHILLTNCEVGPSSDRGHNEFINLVVHGHGTDRFDNGIYLQPGDNLVENCDVYDYPGTGIQTYNAYGQPTNNNIIRGNRVHDPYTGGPTHDGYGMWLTGNDNSIYNNMIYRMGGGLFVSRALQVVNGAQRMIIVNNTLYGNDGNGIEIGYDDLDPVIDTVVRNNIVYLQTGGPAYSNHAGTAGIIQSNNLFGTNPLFVNAAANNFHLLSGSPAIDAGITVAAVTTDIDNDTRPLGAAYDIGVDEYDPGPPPLPSELPQKFKLRFRVAEFELLPLVVGALIVRRRQMRSRRWR